MAWQYKPQTALRADGGSEGLTPGTPPPWRSTPVVGLVIFLAVVTSLFFLLTVAMAMRMQMPDWRTPQLPWQLWVNTTMLCLSSVAMQWTLAIRDNRLKAGIVFLAAGLLACAFLGGQWLAWLELFRQGQTPAANPANGFFYLISGIHAAHILGGLVAWLVAMHRLLRRPAEPATRVLLTQCALYWHFLLLVWGLVFARMLLS